MSDRTSYPLCWPEGWPRTATISREESRFIKPSKPNYSGGYSSRRHYSMDEAISMLMLELERLGAADEILSTNVKFKLNGAPYGQQSQPTDQGAAVFFKLSKRDVSLACDKWNRVECNVLAIAKHIEALRGQERWGVGSIEQAFRGYMALPGIGQTSNANPWATLGITINASKEQATDAYRMLAKKFHPDIPVTGDADRFNRIKQAYDLIVQNHQ